MSIYTLETVTEPTSEPVPMDEIAAHVRTNSSDDYGLISTYLSSARMLFENLTGVQCMPATYRLHLDDWSCDYPYYWRWGIYDYNSYQFHNRIVMPKHPVTAVTSITYYDGDNVQQTLSASDYSVDSVSNPSAIYLYNTPGLYPNRHPRIQVNFTAGYASQTAVPYLIRQAIKLLTGHFYENREGYTTDDLKTTPMGFQQIVNNYKTNWIGVGNA